LTKTKRIREVPESFEALKTIVEALITDERALMQEKDLVKKGDRDYVVRYTDKDNELIDVSDEEDFLTAYEIAENEMDGNLKFVVDFRKPVSLTEGEAHTAGREAIKKLIKDAKKEKKESDKLKKEKDKQERKAKKLLKKKAKKGTQVEEEKAQTSTGEKDSFNVIEEDSKCLFARERANTVS